MVDMLQQMAKRWAGLVRYDSRYCDNAAGKYAERLGMLLDKCQNSPDFGLDVLDYPNDSLLAIEKNFVKGKADFAQNLSEGFSSTLSTVRGTTRDGGIPERLIPDWTEKPFFMDSPPQEPQDAFRKQSTQAAELTSPSFTIPDAPIANSQMGLDMSYAQNVEGTCETESDLVALSQTFMEPSFASMDRIIGLSNSFLEDLI